MSDRPTPTQAFRDLAMAHAQQRQAVKVPTYAVSDERGPGGIVIALARYEIPVCEWFPTPQDAEAELLAAYQRFRLLHPAPNGGTG